MLRHYLEPVQHELDREDVTDFCINRPGEYWLQTYKGWECRPAPWLTYDFGFSLAEALANFNDKSIDDEDSTLSCRLPGGERCEIVMPPSSEAGTVVFGIRKPSIKRLAIDGLAGAGELGHIRRVCSSNAQPTPLEEELLGLYRHDQWEQFIRLAVASRQNIVFSGPTGSGKTTFGKAWMDLVPPWERVITSEDVPEISLPYQRNHVHLFYDKDGQTRSRVTAARLLQSCLRLNPTRILQAELRSDEAYDFFNTVNTGHPGSMTTTHANSPLQAFDRLASLVAQSERARNMAYADIRKMLVQSIDVIVQCEQVSDSGGNQYRRMTSIYYDPEHKRKAAL